MYIITYQQKRVTSERTYSEKSTTRPLLRQTYSVLIDEYINDYVFLQYYY